MSERIRTAMTTGAAGNPGPLRRPVVRGRRCQARAGRPATREPGGGVRRFGRIDVLCNLAGGFRMGEAVHETADANWDLLFDIGDWERIQPLK